MEDKLDFRKKYKDLYLPTRFPALIMVPPILYIMVDGSGPPEGQEYQDAMQLLYSLSFTIKMSKMGGRQPEGYFDYVVAPLEGLWARVGQTDYSEFMKDRAHWAWTSMIRQPDFVTPEVFEWAQEEVRRTCAKKKRPVPALERARLEWYEEGYCAQAMHTGPYSAEGETIGLLGNYIREQNLRDDCGDVRRHHEIYLSDPRRCAPEKCRTVLRHPVVENL